MENTRHQARPASHPKPVKYSCNTPESGTGGGGMPEKSSCCCLSSILDVKIASTAGIQVEIKINK